VFRHRHGDVKPAFVQCRRAGDARYRRVVDAGLPQQLARRRVHGVDVRLLIAEVGYITFTVWRRADDDGGANRERSRKLPDAATGPGIERINIATGAAKKEAPAGYGRLRVGGDGRRQPESPAQA